MIPMRPKETIEQFDAYLAEQGLALSAVVVGGAALGLLGVVSRQTRLRTATSSTHSSRMRSERHPPGFLSSSSGVESTCARIGSTTALHLWLVIFLMDGSSGCSPRSRARR